MKAETLIEQDSNQSPGDQAKSYLTRRRALIVISVLVLALLGFAVAALSLGSERVASGRLFPALTSKLPGPGSPLSRGSDVIIFTLRLTRIARPSGACREMSSGSAA